LYVDFGGVGIPGVTIDEAETTQPGQRDASVGGGGRWLFLFSGVAAIVPDKSTEEAIRNGNYWLVQAHCV
jgi:hypothetical protein